MITMMWSLTLPICRWKLRITCNWYEVIADESAVVLLVKTLYDTNYNDVAASDADQVVDVEAVSQVSAFISSGDTIRAPTEGL